MIRIRSKTPGFRRCGIAHPATATEYADDDFTPEQLEQLLAEPELLVELIDYEPNTHSTDDQEVQEAGGGEDGTARDAPGQPQTDKSADAPARNRKRA